MNRVPRLEELALAEVMGPRNVNIRSYLRELISDEQGVIAYMYALSDKLAYCRYCLRFSARSPTAEYHYWCLCYRHYFKKEGLFQTVRPLSNHL